MSATHQIISAALVLALGAAPALAAPSPAVDLALANRAGWGLTPSSADEVEKLGADRWLQQQLHPGVNDPLPPDAQAQIQALSISQKPMDQIVRELEAQNQAANALTDPDQKKAAQQAYQQALNDLSREAATRSLLRDLYSPDQLKEQLTWFWLNHFNVQAGKANIRAMIGDYEETAIRPHALGHFRDLLEATLRHPAMLRYLDNADNAAGHANENYARELMELHTMGVGSGYTQKDVQELARILTGVGIDAKPDAPKLRSDHAADLIRSGLFEFNPNRHDYGDKLFLGHVIKGRGFAEVEEALDILGKEPETARHVSRQLAQYFVADDPPPALVAAMAQTFQRTDGDIAAVLDTMFHAKAFRDSLGTKFKDPVHYAVSAVRLAYGDRVILNTQPIQGWLGRMGESLYGHETPDGYPMTAADWDGPGQMALRFEIARQIGTGSAGLFKAPIPNAADQPAFPQLQNALYFDALQRTLSPATDGALGKAVSAEDWNVLFLASPEFMRR